jgi:hypothetical protein
VDLSSFIVAVFCLVDDQLKGKPLRQRGPSPKLSDYEVLTIEIIGEFLGIDTETRVSTSSFEGTTVNGSPLSVRYIGLPSPGRQPTSGSSKRTSGKSSFRLHPMTLRSPSLRLFALASVLVCPRPPLPSLSR